MPWTMILLTRPICEPGLQEALIGLDRRTHPLVGSVLSSDSSGILFAVFWPWHCLGSLNPSENVKTFRRHCDMFPVHLLKLRAEPAATKRHDHVNCASMPYRTQLAQPTWIGVVVSLHVFVEAVLQSCICVKIHNTYE